MERSSQPTFRTEIATMKRWRPMLELLDALDADAEDVSKTNIEEVWNGFVGGMQSSCDAVADALMAALASICSRREDMLETLLPDTIEPMLMLGVEDANAVIEWAAVFTEREVLYMGRPDDCSFIWIEESFMASEVLIQAALNKHF